MRCLDLRYGFVTNYEETFFLMQGHEEVAPKQFIEVLYCSRPINYKNVGSSGEVSVRQCLVYLQHLVQEAWKYKSQRSGRVTRREHNENAKKYNARNARQSEKENAPTPIRSEDIHKRPGGSTESPLAHRHKDYDPESLARDVKKMGLLSQDYDIYSDHKTRKGYESLTGDSGGYERSGQPRRHGKSVMINEDDEEYEHGYSSSLFKSYQPRSGSRTAYEASTTPAPRQGYPASTAPFADNPYSDAFYTCDPYIKAPYTSDRAATPASSGYGHGSYGSSAVSQAPHMGSGQGHGYTSSGQGHLDPNYGERGSGPRHSRSPSGRSPEDRSRERTRERPSRSRRELEPEPESNPYEKPRGQNRRLQKDKYDKYSRP